MSDNRLPIRNIILLGHSHSGKTSLAETLLSTAGAIPNPGSVNTGTSVSDYNEDEKERKISINSSVLHFEKNGTKVNVVDAPGYGDFIGEVLDGLQAVDSAVIVVNAIGGIENGTQRALKLTGRLNVPSMIFINRLDRENADFGKCINALTERLGKKCVVLTYPIGSEASFKGVVDLMSKENIGELGAEEKAAAEKLAESLVENVAESDDKLLEKYLDKGELAKEEIEPALTKAILEGKIIPIMVGSAAKGIGVNELIDFILSDMPSPDEMPPKEAVDGKTNEKISVSTKDDFFSAQVFKTVSDPYVGQISIFRIISGTILSNGSVYNTSKKGPEKLGQLFVVQGKEQKHVASASAGDIIACAKLKNTATGDSLSTEKHQVVFPEFKFPEPAISFSIKPKTRSDEDKISTALHKLMAEDMTFKIVRDAQTKELVVSGMGDLHINIMIKRLKSRYGVQVDVGTPKVAYKETITTAGSAQYRHKKQSGGAGQFAEVWMRVEPLARGGGFEFVNEVVGGAIPGPFIVSCEKGIRASMGEGALAGFPLVDVRAVVYDGKTHPVDSKDIAFQIASKHGFREAVLKAKPVLLEPIMDVEVSIPDEFMGDITGSLNSRRGRIMGMEPGLGTQIVKAKVPLEEMYKWANELKALTGGRGNYTMRFSHYETIPGNLVQQIVAKAKAAKEEAKA